MCICAEDIERKRNELEESLKEQESEITKTEEEYDDIYRRGRKRE